MPQELLPAGLLWAPSCNVRLHVPRPAVKTQCLLQHTISTLHRAQLQLRGTLSSHLESPGAAGRRQDFLHSAVLEHSI